MHVWGMHASPGLACVTVAMNDRRNSSAESSAWPSMRFCGLGWLFGSADAAVVL